MTSKSGGHRDCQDVISKETMSSIVIGPICNDCVPVIKDTAEEPNGRIRISNRHLVPETESPFMSGTGLKLPCASVIEASKLFFSISVTWSTFLARQKTTTH